MERSLAPALFGNDFCAKGQEGNLRQLKMLQAEGNANNSYAAVKTEKHVGQGHLDAAENNPQDIHNNGAGGAADFDIFAKGEEAQLAKFEALQANGNPHNCQAPQETDKIPEDACNNSAQNKPKDITYNTHCPNPPIINLSYCRKRLYIIILTKICPFIYGFSLSGRNKNRQPWNREHQCGF